MGLGFPISSGFQPSMASAAEGSFFMGGVDSCLEMPGIWNATIAARVGANALRYRAWVALICRELTGRYAWDWQKTFYI